MRQSVVAMLLEEELHNQHENLFHPDEIVATVYDRIPLKEIPAQYRKDVRAHLSTVLKRILSSSKSNCFRAYSAINVGGTWYYKHVSAMDPADVRHVIVSFDERIKALQDRRAQWQAIHDDMVKRKRASKSPVYAHTSVEALACDWIPKRIG